MDAGRMWRVLHADYAGWLARATHPPHSGDQLKSMPGCWWHKAPLPQDPALLLESTTRPNYCYLLVKAIRVGSGRHIRDTSSTPPLNFLNSERVNLSQNSLQQTLNASKQPIWDSDLGIARQYQGPAIWDLKSWLLSSVASCVDPFCVDLPLSKSSQSSSHYWAWSYQAHCHAKPIQTSHLPVREGTLPYCSLEPRQLRPVSWWWSRGFLIGSLTSEPMLELSLCCLLDQVQVLRGGAVPANLVHHYR